MTTYYVDPVNGLDANNGLGPDASAVTNKPWKTMGKALGAAGASSGDTVWMAPGTYREAVTVAATPASTLAVKADPGNAQGFKTSGGVAVSGGPIVWTGYTTSDKVAGSGNSPLNLNGSSFMSFQGIQFIPNASGANVRAINATTATSHDISFTDCAFVAGGTTMSNTIIEMTTVFGTALNWTIDRCHFLLGATGSGIRVNLPSGSGADYDANVLVKNSKFFDTPGVFVNGSGAGAQFGGGVRMRNCLVLGATALTCSGAGLLSTTIPCTLTNSVCYNPGNVFVSASTLGMITEDYNIAGANGRTNVTAGTHSRIDNAYSHMIHFGQEVIWGMERRPWGEPMAGSPYLAFGNDGNQSATDNENRPRPAGGLSAVAAVGPLERGNTWTQQTTTVHGTAPAGAVVTGPGYIDYEVEVDAIAQSLSVWMQFDGTYDATGTAKPTFEVLANAEIGVSAATATMTAVASTWQQLTLNFTPTAKGVVTIRLRSQDVNGAGKAYASDKAGW